jgi:hypothetical protein
MFAMKREQRSKIGDPAFVDRTIEFVRRNALKFVYRLDEDELRRRVVHCIGRARAHGLAWESSISTFVLHMITIHPRFDDQPYVASILADTSIPVEERVAALLQMPDDAWEQAAKQGDADAYWAAVRAAEGAQS